MFIIILSIIYCSHITRAAQYEHPCSQYIYQPEVRLRMELGPSHPDPPRHTNFHPHSALVPANPYLNQGIVIGFVHAQT